MSLLRWLLVLIVLVAPAHAAEVVFPPGSRIGLAPPPGLVQSHSFFGFEDRDRKVAVIITPLPAKVFDEITRSTSAESLKAQGVIPEKREDVTLASGKALLVVGRQELNGVKLHKWILIARMPDMTAVVIAQVPDDARDAYPDEALRASLTSLAVRAAVPVEEQLSLLPFKITDLAGFHIGGLLSGRAVVLTDAPADAADDHLAAHFVVAMAPGGPKMPADRAPFARDMFATIPNISDVRLVSSEPLRIGNQQGHQIMAHAKDASGADVTVVQWLRFGGGAFMQMVGVAPSDAWLKAYARFRQVRDSIETR